MIEVSKLLLRFRSPIFRKTDSPYDSEFGALSEYSQYHKPLLVQQDSRKLATDENTCLHHQYDIGEQGVSILCIYLSYSLVWFSIICLHGTAKNNTYVKQIAWISPIIFLFIYLSICLFISFIYSFLFIYFIYLFYLFFILFIYLFFFCIFIFILHNSLNIAESIQRKTRSYSLNFWLGFRLVYTNFSMSVYEL